jgi:two-component system, NtrC family, sensor kinase
VVQFDEGLLHLVAVHSLSPEETAAFHSLFPRPPSRNFVMGRAFLDAQAVHFEDVLAELDFGSRTLDVPQSVAKYRSFLGVPISRQGKPIGVIGCGRREVKPFSASQIELLKTFTDQAAIAIENVRLFNALETRNRDLGEALEQQTATAEVLQLINSLPGDLTPVFDATLDRALRLCEAAFGILSTYKGDDLHQVVAMRGVPSAISQLLRQPVHLGPETGMGRLTRGERFVHIADAADDNGYRLGNPVRRALVDVGGTRTYLAVPLRKDDLMLGAFTIYRQEVRPFTDKQIALLENFAAQAVIAMENARLITETREALEQQTATAEVLQVINLSPGDLAPVFDAMLEKAMHLCEASFGELRTYGDGQFQLAAIRGVPAPYADYMARNAPVYGPGTGPARILEGERAVHIVDLPNTENYRNGEPARRALVDLGGARTLVLVPLLKDAGVCGFSWSTARRCGRFPINKSRCCRISPRRR